MIFFISPHRSLTFPTDVEPLVEAAAEGHPAAKDPETDLARLLADEFTDLDLERFVAVLPARRPNLGFNLLEYQAEAPTRARLKKGEGSPYRVGWPCQDEVVANSSRSVPFLAVMGIGLLIRGY